MHAEDNESLRQLLEQRDRHISALEKQALDMECSVREGIQAERERYRSMCLVETERANSLGLQLEQLN